MKKYIMETFRPSGGGYSLSVDTLEEGIAEGRRYWDHTGGRDGADLCIRPLCVRCENTGRITLRVYKRKPALRAKCPVCGGAGVLDAIYVDTGA